MITWKRIAAGQYEGVSSRCATLFQISRDSLGYWMVRSGRDQVNTTTFTAKTSLKAAKEACKEETVPVRIEIGWGRKWDPGAGYCKETPGVGMYCQVMESRVCNSMFTGCPLGRNENISTALEDFILVGKSEYQGDAPLSLEMLDVQDILDNRRREEIQDERLGFYQTLTDNPDDWNTRSILADWYLDHDQPLAARCLQWQINRKIRAYPSVNKLFHARTGVRFVESYVWERSVALIDRQAFCDHMASLPANLFDALDSVIPVGDDRWQFCRGYISLRRAEEALQEAFALYWHRYGEEP